MQTVPQGNEISIDSSNRDPDNTSVAADMFMKVYNSCQDSSSDLSPVKRSEHNVSVSLPPHPENWPQRPLLLRPTPGAGMKIHGVRYSSSKTYLSSYKEGGILPINNGFEASGRCLVIDFESDVFIGTACLRLKNAPRSECDTNTSDSSKKDLLSTYYFHNKKRTFQSIIRGRFKRRIPMSECVTGQMFTRSPGVVPPRVIVKAAVLLVSRLAPQLQTRLEGNCPRFLSPLCSTAQTICAKKKDKTTATATDEDLEDELQLQEPHPSEPSSLLQSLPWPNTENHHPSMSLDSNTTAHIKIRKKAFDKLYATGNTEPSFCTDSEYCFEFFQHLILFDKFALDFPKPVGQHSLQKILNGQPMQILAMHQTKERRCRGKVIGEQFTKLWSFDIWHESIYDDAITQEKKESMQ